MNRHIALFTAILALSLLPTQSFAVPGAHNSPEYLYFQAQYSSLGSMWAHRDVKKLENWFSATAAPSFRSYDSKGNIHTRQQTLRQIDDIAGRTDMGSVRYELSSVNVTGSTAVVNVVEVHTYTDTQNRRHPHKIVSRLANRDTWVKTGAKWLWKERQAAPKAEVTSDGKRI